MLFIGKIWLCWTESVHGFIERMSKKVCPNFSDVPRITNDVQPFKFLHHAFLVYFYVLLVSVQLFATYFYRWVLKNVCKHVNFDFKTLRLDIFHYFWVWLQWLHFLKHLMAISLLIKTVHAVIRKKPKNQRRRSWKRLSLPRSKATIFNFSSTE